MDELLSKTQDELKTVFENLQQAPYRAKQLFKWLHMGAPFSEMTDLPKALREKLQDRYAEGYILEKTVLTSKDGTKKFLFELSDGQLVESVFMQKDYGNTACLSTQVGCRMGCVFCASGEGGLVRNLTAGEMLAQLIGINRHTGIRTDHIVLMGMGEPLDNYENVVKFLRLVTNEDGLNLSRRGISLSTCGVVENIHKLAEEDLGITLSISLHAPTDEQRAQIMRSARHYKITDILSAAKDCFEKTGRRIIFEYLLIDGFNDRDIDVRALAKLLKKINCHINIIPFNETGNSRFVAPAKNKAYAFCGKLEEAGLSATVRKSMGADIAGACGQLRGKAI
ncbi:MAG: 23S rRNA (adenine(2503)-C(2))-methyltransferase RlmN [Christensenellaceae bacterium]